MTSRQPDPNFLLCTAYDDEIRFNTPTFQELPSYHNITLLVNEIIRENDIFGNPMITISGSDGQQFQSINSKLHQATIVVYISSALSVILTVAFLLLGIATLTLYCKLRHSNLESNLNSCTMRMNNQSQFMKIWLMTLKALRWRLMPPIKGLKWT